MPEFGVWASYSGCGFSGVFSMIQVSKPDFPIGILLATPAALEALQEADVNIIDLVERHISKDWGDLSDEDKKTNG